MKEDVTLKELQPNQLTPNQPTPEQVQRANAALKRALELAQLMVKNRENKRNS